MKGLLFITHQTERYDHLRSVELALEGGCRQIQLRMKGASSVETEAVARRAKRLCDRYGAALYINDHVEVCRKINAAGVHLGKSDMPPSEARAMLGDGFVIGGSANTFDDVAALHRQPVDYIGLGPLRPTATKTDLNPILGAEKFRSLVKQCRDCGLLLPILAIGGITIGDLSTLMTTGIAGVALSGAILNAENPVEATGEILKRLSLIQTTA
jgi:thiamine-phosphate pyrophosphorylase